METREIIGFYGQNIILSFFVLKVLIFLKEEFCTINCDKMM